MNPQFQREIQSVCDATGIEKMEVIQQLWSGYGEILRVHLKGGSVDTIVAKHVRIPVGGSHPRGWNTNLSHERKVHSYRVETNWYRDWSQKCRRGSRIPSLLSRARDGDEVLLVMEDLDAAGFPARHSQIEWPQIRICLQWLASFHATFLGEKPVGLWETGTYWHLETRPDELEALKDVELKAGASALDQRLKDARFQTFVHGDAKLANFCFSEDGQRVAAVDFQYVGGGCGMKDVAYFMGSCMDERSCEEMEGQMLDTYFGFLREGLAPEMDSNAIEDEWRSLFPVAWTDFHRFLKGWSPGHWKINSYSERLAREVLARL